MKTKHLKTVKDFKGKVAIDELRRAHVIIATLALALMFVIIATILEPLQFDAVLGAIAALLLLFVSLVSAGIALRLRRR